jgi:hypothetical protein
MAGWHRGQEEAKEEEGPITILLRRLREQTMRYARLSQTLRILHW